MRTRLIFVIIMIASWAGAATQKSALNMKPVLLASLEIESMEDKVQYKILSSSIEKEARLEKINNQEKSKIVKIPKGLALTIKGDLLSLSWQILYPPKRKNASTCVRTAKIYVESEDTVSVCQEQRIDFNKIRNIETQLNSLIEVKNN